MLKHRQPEKKIRRQKEEGGGRKDLLKAEKNRNLG